MSRQDPQRVQPGCWVRIRDPELDEEETFHLVEPDDEQPTEGLISTRSTFAQALIGSQPGEVIQVETRTGTETLEIVATGWDR
jgi:transcription elongation GreA/GreB family factor